MCVQSLIIFLEGLGYIVQTHQLEGITCPISFISRFIREPSCADVQAFVTILSTTQKGTYFRSSHFCVTTMLNLDDYTRILKTKPVR